MTDLGDIITNHIKISKGRKEMAMYYVYIMTNKTNSVMYTGVTNDLERRAVEHKSGICDCFTKRYHLSKLVYFEEYSDVNQAICREK